MFPTFFTATSLTFLKPRFKRTLLPVAARLAETGVTANHVTTLSLAGSITFGVILSASPPHPALFAILPVWLLARMGCATIDGTLAIEFGQKSRLGGILNEVGDIVSDIALFLPLAFVPPFSVAAIVTIAFLIALAELAGIAGAIFGSDRRLEGPLGKADRSIVLALIGMAVVVFGELPPSATVVLPVFSAGLIATAWNRFCCAGVLGYRAVVTPQRPEPRHTP